MALPGSDRFRGSYGDVSDLTWPATSAAAVTPSDGVDLTSIPRALYVGVSGDITVDMEETGSTILFKAVPVGILPIRVKRIRATGTTATNILALE